ncbi:MAG: hypothetical protein AAB074_02265 [Planctomycetota bacterium]
MAIKVRCPGCRQKIRYSKAPHGSQGRCPRCAAVVLTMEIDSDPDASIGPAASHDAVVPGPRRHSNPADDTAVFTPLFPHPVPAISPPPSAVAPACRQAPPNFFPTRWSVLARRGYFGNARLAGGSFAPRRSVAPALAGSLAGNLASGIGFAVLLGLSLVGASVLGLWAIVVLTQFPR